MGETIPLNHEDDNSLLPDHLQNATNFISIAEDSLSEQFKELQFSVMNMSKILNAEDENFTQVGLVIVGGRDDKELIAQAGEVATQVAKEHGVKECEEPFFFHRPVSLANIKLGFHLHPDPEEARKQYEKQRMRIDYNF